MFCALAPWQGLVPGKYIKTSTDRNGKHYLDVNASRNLSAGASTFTHTDKEATAIWVVAVEDRLGKWSHVVRETVEGMRLLRSLFIWYR